MLRLSIVTSCVFTPSTRYTIPTILLLYFATRDIHSFPHITAVKSSHWSVIPVLYQVQPLSAPEYLCPLRSKLQAPPYSLFCVPSRPPHSDSLLPSCVSPRKALCPKIVSEPSRSLWIGHCNFFLWAALLPPTSALPLACTLLTCGVS